MSAPQRVALYARVSTSDQTCENQLRELREYCQARGFTVVREYLDVGVSGTKATRPALDEMDRDARRRRFDTVVVWRLDRLGRSLKHLIVTLESWRDVGVSFVSLAEGVDLSTPAGTLQLHILAALAQFERARIVERVNAGLARARAQGVRLGRKPLSAVHRLESCQGLSHESAAAQLGVSSASVKRWRRASRRAGSQSPAATV